MGGEPRRAARSGQRAKWTRARSPRYRTGAVPPPYRIDSSSLERDTIVDIYVGGGPGGQHRNKTANAVRLHHQPSGARVTATERRSLTANLDTAFERLRAKLEALNEVKPPRRATQVPRREKRKRIESKVHTATRKQTRARVLDRDRDPE